MYNDSYKFFERYKMKDEYDFSKRVQILESCQLRHRDEEERKAVDYLNQDFSDGVNKFGVSILVCEDCINKLNNKDWKLWYCISCMESWWIPKHESRKKELYENNEIMWVSVCKYCYGG